MAMDRFPSNILDFIKKYRKKVKEILGIEGPEYSPEDVSNEDVDALFDGGGGGGSSSSSSSESGSGEDPSIMTDELFDQLVGDFFTDGDHITLTGEDNPALGMVVYGNSLYANMGFNNAQLSGDYSGYLLYLNTDLVGIVLNLNPNTWMLYPADSTGQWEESEFKLNLSKSEFSLENGASFDSVDIPVLRDNDYLRKTSSINLYDTGSGIYGAYEFL